MAKYIELGFHLTDELGLKSITFNQNDTHLDCDSELLERIAKTILTSIAINQDGVSFQNLLNKNNISLTKGESR